jgi:hypothetical protein
MCYLIFALSVLALVGFNEKASADFRRLTNRGERVIRISDDSEKITEFDIVVETGTPLLDFAAGELQGFLGSATGKCPPIVTAPVSGRMALILGDNTFSRQAGISVTDLPTEAFHIRRVDDRVFLCGEDSTTLSVRDARGTLTAVYDFLERFCGVRFYFPGEYGTIIPQQAGLFLPKTIEILDRPDFIERSWLHYNYVSKSKLYEGAPKEFTTLERLRLRYSTLAIMSNAIPSYDLIGRFGKSHPEYFAQMPDGSRYFQRSSRHNTHLCFESAVREVIYQDVKAFLSGRDPASRGLKSWAKGAFGYAPYLVTLCPDDSFYPCHCEKCSQIVNPDLAYSSDKQKLSNYIWQFTADIANRLKKENVPGYVIQLAYSPYNLTPAVAIPDNVLIAIAVFPGITRPDNPRMAVTEAAVAPWIKVADGRLFFRAWTGKLLRMIPGIPLLQHNHIGPYFSRHKGHYLGCFMDEATDYALSRHLNVYVFSRLAWNNDVDTEAVISEYFQLMFGEAASEIRHVYDELERLWDSEVVRGVQDGPLGAVYKLADTISLWTDIYSIKKMEELNACFDRAEMITSGMEKRRVQFIRRNLFGPLQAESDHFRVNQQIGQNWSLRPGQTVWLRPHRGEMNEVQTQVTFSESSDSFIFDFDCQEPDMDKIKAMATQRDDLEIYKDSDVEILIRPSDKSGRYYQFAANANGALADWAWEKNNPDAPGILWNSTATAKAETSSSGWKVLLTIPKDILEGSEASGIQVNLGRHRALNGIKVKETFYKYSPFSGGNFNDFFYWAKLDLENIPDRNLIQNPDFAQKEIKQWGFPSWIIGGDSKENRATMDERFFISGGRSLNLVNISGKKIFVRQWLKGLEPETRYRLSFFVRMENVEESRKSLFCGLYYQKELNHYVPHNLYGTHGWTSIVEEFSTPKVEQMLDSPWIGLWLMRPGEAWFDHIRLEKLDPGDG